MTANILNLVPTVLRARGFRLYTESSSAGGSRKRLVDLWQNGGAAILGHTPPNMLHEIKNTASRGLYAPFPHFLEARFIKALTRLLPGRTFRLYAAPPSGEIYMEHGSLVGYSIDALLKNGTAGLWRPFLDPASPFAIEKNAPPILIPVLPGIHGWRDDLPLGLCILAVQSENEPVHLPAGDILSPVLLAAAARGVYDLLASPERGKPAFPRIAKALQKSPACSRWQRQGIYLTPKEKPEWEVLFRQFLDAGFLIPPVPSQPLILPGELSAGEEAKLAALLSAATA